MYVVLLLTLAITWMGCAPTTSTVLCGNGELESGEECDPPDGDTCDTDCTIIEDTEPVCGDSVIDPGEDCDPPDGASCDAACQTIPGGGAVCGNSVVEAGEDCAAASPHRCSRKKPRVRCQDLAAEKESYAATVSLKKPWAVS